ncbi:MAG: hemolysin family protein [bacterium]|nr:hemolysin family protein [bacterium]
MLGNISLTLFFVFLNGFFVAAEFAIVKVRASQIELKARQGNMFAGVAKHLLDHLDAYLSASQLGITLASLGLGWIGESVVSVIISDLISLVGISLAPDILHKVSFWIAFATITVLHIVLGEMAPKSFAIRRPEAVTLAVALPMRGFYIVFKPIIMALNNMANAILRMMGVEPAPEHEVHSPEEIRYLIKESSDKGALELSERELIENVFEFTETTAGQIMIPRSNIVGLDVSHTMDELLDRVMEEGYSRLPVFNQTVDDIVGIVYAKDLLTLMHHKDLIILQDILRPAYFVSEDVKLKKLLREMQHRKVLLAIVLDEFGGTAGLITLENVIEELVGSIQDEYDDDRPQVVRKTRNQFELPAAMRIDEANETLPYPLPESDDYETLGGLINSVAGRIPAKGDVVDLQNYRCTILESSPRRVERVVLRVHSSDND